MNWAWVVIVVVAAWTVPAERMANGSMTRLAFRVLRLGRVSRGWRWFVRPLIFWPLPWRLFVAAMLVVLLDDWLTGRDDDRWKRRFEGVRNCVKWLMDLPAATRSHPA